MVVDPPARAQTDATTTKTPSEEPKSSRECMRSTYRSRARHALEHSSGLPVWLSQIRLAHIASRINCLRADALRCGHAKTAWLCESSASPRAEMRTACVPGRNACPGHCGNCSTSLGTMHAAPPLTQAGRIHRTRHATAAAARGGHSRTRTLRRHHCGRTARGHMMRLKTCAGCFTNHPPQDLTRGRCPDCIRSYERAKSARRTSSTRHNLRARLRRHSTASYASRRSQPIPTAQTAAQPTT